MLHSTPAPITCQYVPAQNLHFVNHFVTFCNPATNKKPPRSAAASFRFVVVIRSDQLLIISANGQNPVFLSERSESKDLRTDLMFRVSHLRRSFAPLRKTTSFVVVLLCVLFRADGPRYPCHSSAGASSDVLSALMKAIISSPVMVSLVSRNSEISSSSDRLSTSRALASE